MGDENPEGEIILGTQKANPYTPENMTLALNALVADGYTVPSSLSIRPTHYYVKFKPENWEQYAILVQDTAHVYFDTPLDYNVLVEGNCYHDPAVVTDSPTYQYTTVEVDYVFDNNCPYDIISQLYIPEQDANFSDDNFKEALLDKAYIQTGNFEDTVKNTDFAERRSAYRPGGRILINDNRLNQDIGLEGVLITARRWFTIFKGNTDNGGAFLVNGNFLRPCNYRLHFEAFGFNVRNQFFNVVAFISRPGEHTTDWQLTIGQGDNNFHGHIFRGAYRYHYRNIDGLLRPFRPLGNFTNYIAKDRLDKGASGLNVGIIPIIRIGKSSSNGTLYTNDDVFSATIHETAHTTHIILLNNNVATFLLVKTIIRESWAVAVEWWITGMEYKERGIANYGESNFSPTNPPIYPNEYGYQYWSKSTNSDYTSLFINCLDTFNEAEQQFGTRPDGTVIDMVGGTFGAHIISQPYSIKNLERNVIRHVNDLTSTANYLKATKPAGLQNHLIDLLI